MRKIEENWIGESETRQEVCKKIWNEIAEERGQNFLEDNREESREQMKVEEEATSIIKKSTG